MNGGLDDDVYLFGRGDGQDLVDEAASTAGDADTIRFDAGILPTDIEVVHSMIGGALYPAKDAAMTAPQFQSFYPQWQQFARFRDPMLTSSFWERVTGDRPTL